MFKFFKKKKPEVPSNKYNYWHTADGRTIPISELTDDHLINIVKYSLMQHRLPIVIINELYERGLLPVIAADIKPRPGFKSPEELYNEFKLVD